MREFNFNVTHKKLLESSLDVLLDNSGYAFHDPESRQAFFSDIERFPYKVELGTALAHAYSQNMGLFGNEGNLFEDCVRIMVTEMRRWQFLNGLYTDFSVDEVKISKIFQQSYFIARQPKIDANNNLFYAFGINDSIKIISKVDYDPLIHSEVYEEIRGKYPIAQNL